MASVSTYLNFDGTCAEAFEHYAKAFGTEITAMMRMGDAPPGGEAPDLPESMKDLVANVQLPILAGHVIMGSDMPPGMERHVGNTATINVVPDTRTETERLFNALSDGGSNVSPLADMFWGAYWGTCTDRYGIQWMFNCYEPATS